MDKLRVGLCGLGTVGQGVLSLLQKNAEIISQRSGCVIEVVRVASRTEKPQVDLAAAIFSTRIDDLVEDDSVDVIVEAIGGSNAALSLFRSAISAKKHIITANKALIAEHGVELIPLAQDKTLFMGYEAAVAGGIPILKVLREGLAGNTVSKIAGIINGTSNFILTAMSQAGDDFKTALKEAQDLGYAEADPTFDIEGVDAAHKLTIMASLAFGVPMDFSSVYMEGISTISAEDIRYASDLGYRIKHLGICTLDDSGLSVRVHPALVPDGQMLANVEGVMNAVKIESDALGASMYMGPGAGGLPTASSIVGDLIDLARGNTRAVPLVNQIDRMDIANITSAYYLRIPAIDRPGVLAEVAQILSVHGISIEAVTQREHRQNDVPENDWVPVIIITDQVLEFTMNSALERIQELGDVVGDIARIRVESPGVL
ncbi:MAG: homoserine dehydrogenase [Pseudomonadales bacterium]|nr:homoserine dehydrogenase [Pseudomonadales bacterium]